jgi:glycosyltransferase involved in cell wall biosynthesis
VVIMNICFASHRYAPMVGGYENQIRLIAENLPKNFNVKVVTFNLKGWNSSESINGVEVIRVKPQLTLFRVPLTINFLRVLNKLDFDILHAHGFVPIVSDLSVVLAKSQKKSVVYTHHFDGNVQDSGFLNNIANCYNEFIGKSSISFADAIVATSKSYAETSPILKHQMKKVRIIPCSVDCEAFKPQPSQKVQDLKRQLGLIDERVVLFVGRVVPYKGLQYLIKAIQRINSKGEKYHLLVIGGEEGKQITDASPYYHGIQNLVKTSGFKERIHFLGRVDGDQLPCYYSLADVVVLPSVMRGEAFGSVLLESLACGTPVVASNLPGVNSVLKGNVKIGRYVVSKDEFSLSIAIAKMAYSKSDNSNACRDFAIENYSKQKIVNDYVKIYSVLKN